MTEYTILKKEMISNATKKIKFYEQQVQLWKEIKEWVEQ